MRRRRLERRLDLYSADRRDDRIGMNEADALELMRSAMWTVLVVAGPAIGAAMVVGIIIALFQALTQIQEMTLTFVPKIVVVLAVLTIGASFIGAQIYVFTEQAYSRIEKGY